ncbi:MAG: arylamine N-acetyltransferase [Microlunatus sp.]
MEDRYLRRIGLSGPAEDWGPEPAESAGDRLTALVAAHQASVPFENLSLHDGEPAFVDPAVTVAKVVTRHRGGICYELNSALGWLLQRLGWRVAWHAGRVRGADGRYGLPLGHLALIVSTPFHSTTGGDRWLVDVGFGGDAVCGPVERLVTGLDGPEAEAVVRDLDGVRVGYLLETRSRPLGDFAGMAWWHSTSPAARFTGSLVCTVTRGGQRITLAGRRFKITDPGPGAGERRTSSERWIADAAELLDVYREVFGIELDAEPVQRQSAANGSPR